MHGPWLTAPLWLTIAPSTRFGGNSIVPPLSVLGYAGRTFAQIDPIEWGEVRPAQSVGIEYEATEGTDPPGGPTLDISLIGTSATPATAPGYPIDVQAQQLSTTGLTIPAGTPDPTMWPVAITLVYPAGPFRVHATQLVGGPQSWGVFLEVPALDPLTPDYTGLEADVAWVFQPPRYRYIYGGVPPLQQRQRGDGLTGAARSGRGTNTRQDGLFQRGIF